MQGKKRVLIMKKRIKEYNELDFTDDFMFCMILENNLELCKELLELILDIKIKKVELADSQKRIDLTYDGKGVRLDVYVNDSENTVYDIEMQTTKQKELPKRTRYYQGMIDLNSIQKGMDYSELKKTYVIFICLKDVFGKNLPIYTFNSICEQDHSIRLGDEATKVILNAEGSREGLSENMCRFLDYLIGKKATDSFTQKLQDAVDSAIAKKEWEVLYMTFAMKIREERKEASFEAKVENTIEIAKEFNADHNTIIMLLQKKVNLSPEEAEEALNDYESGKKNE
jgi:predicted transposase/invertase (TIGR01784 family)